VDRDPGVGLDKGDDRPGGLFDAQADLRLGILLAQLGQPVVERLGFGFDRLGPLFAGGSFNEVQIGLAIGTIQADDQGGQCPLPTALRAERIWVKAPPCPQT